MYIKTYYSLFLISSSIILISCNDHRPEESNIVKSPIINNQFIQVDTSKSYRFADAWIEPIDSLDISEIKESNDTLIVAACSEYIFNPFGLVENKSKLKTSSLSNFTVNSKEEQIYDDPREYEEFQILTLNSNKLLVHFDDNPDAGPHSFILRGEINNSDVTLAKRVRVGMSVTDFYQTFFRNFPNKLLNQYQVVVLDPCVDDTSHIYTFQKGKLVSIKFVSGTYKNISY